MTIVSRLALARHATLDLTGLGHWGEKTWHHGGTLDGEEILHHQPDGRNPKKSWDVYHRFQLVTGTVPKFGLEC